MNSIQLENQSITQVQLQQSLTFHHNQIFTSHNNQDGYTTLSDIQFDIKDLYDQKTNELEDGEMDTSQLHFHKPLYMQMTPTLNDPFYKNFFAEAQTIPGSAQAKYSQMAKRLNKFFTQREALQSGERLNERINPDYSNPSTYPLSSAVMLYGVDFLSNKDIKKILRLPKDSKALKRINWSNAIVFFDSKIHLEQAIKPHIWDKQKNPFFQPIVQQNLSQEASILEKLPRTWYGLRPYDHKEELIFWFVRYLTSAEPDQLGKMKETIQFMEQYNSAKKLWAKRNKEQEEFYKSSLNTSRFQTIDRSRKDRSVCFGSEPQKRQRSREKSKGVASQKFVRSNVLSEFEQDENYENMLKKHPDLNESYVEPMSFVYVPTNDTLIDTELKKCSDQIIMMMEEMHVGEADTLERVNSGSLYDLDDEMAMISDNFDPRGLDERFFFNRKSKIGQLTTLRPEVRFNYREYTQKILEAEEEIKQKKVIPVIIID